MKGDTYENAQFEYKPHGYIIINGVEAAHTLQCAHCNKHFVSVKGSGKIRGVCLRCNKTTCGAPACDVCVPWEKKLEKEETRWQRTKTKREHMIERQLKIIEKLQKRYGNIPTIGGK